MKPSDNAGIDEILTEKGKYFPYGENLLNLRIEDQQFRIYVVDKEHVVQKPPIDSAFIEILSEGRNEDWRGTLKSESGQPFLSHPRHLYGLYRFELRMILHFPEKENEIFGRVLFFQSEE